MSYPEDPRPAEANARPIFDVADMLQITVGRGAVERVGPCPNCGGRDRFSLNARKNVFLCRRCSENGGKGGPINLVMFVRGLNFPEALDWLCGPRQDLSDAEIAERRRKAAEHKAKREAEAARYRANAIRSARAIWAATVDAEGTAVRGYLERRGITRDLLPQIPHMIRFQPEARYMIPDGPRAWREIYRGPAMVAAVDGPGDGVIAVHRTWLDLDQPKGKVVLPVDGKPGEFWPSKKVLGSKKGGVIRLATPPGADVLVMAEGIETTLSAMVAQSVPGAAYWCGVDLGNMAGRREAGRGLKYAGRPDLSDGEAFVPPSWVRRLIYVMDGDSEPRDTRSKLEAGLRRAMVRRPGLRGQIVQAGDGLDLNDVLMGGGDDD